MLILMKFLFIDESGDLGENGTEYFIITGILTENENKLEKIIKNMRRNKFKKKLSEINELKGTSCSPDIIKYLIKKLNKTDTKIYCIVINKNKYQLNIDKNYLYDYFSGLLAEQIDVNFDLTIRIDRSKAKSEHMRNFNKYFEKRLNTDKKYDVKIFRSYSHGWNCLQIVDIIAWSFFQKFERKNPEFVDLIESKIKIRVIK